MTVHRLPVNASYGDQTVDVHFPDDWNVIAHWPRTPRPLDDDDVLQALRRPCGQLPIRELARGRSRPVIIVDDSQGRLRRLGSCRTSSRSCKLRGSLPTRSVPLSPQEPTAPPAPRRCGRNWVTSPGRIAGFTCTVAYAPLTGLDGRAPPRRCGHRSRWRRRTRAWRARLVAEELGAPPPRPTSPVPRGRRR
jgi:hypothetical protein